LSDKANIYEKDACDVTLIKTCTLDWKKIWLSFVCFLFVTIIEVNISVHQSSMWYVALLYRLSVTLD